MTRGACGRALRAARVKAGISLRAFAEHVGMSATMVSDVENGRRAPLSGERLLRAARFIGADMSILAKLSAIERGEVAMSVDGFHEARVGSLALLLHLAGRLNNEALHRVLDAACAEHDAGNVAPRAKAASPPPMADGQPGLAPTDGAGEGAP